MSEKQSKYTPKTAWKKGQSGNPNGRPKKGLAIADILNASLDVVDGEKTKRELILDKVVALAIEGEQWAIHFIADRTEGRSVERIRKEDVKDEVIVI